MDVKKQFSFLIRDYGLNYKYQKFTDCYGGNCSVETHSFYNDTGCFTIHSVPVRGELDFYYATLFSTTRENLCEQMLDVHSIEPELWDKHTKIGFIKNPFFWWSSKSVLNALAEVLENHVAKHEEFFGIKVVYRRLE